MITVYVVSDICLYREGLAEVLGQREEIRVVGAAATCEDLLALLDELSPDIALVDLSNIESVSVVHELAERAPNVKVVAIGVPETEQRILECAEAGVRGYVPREGSLADLTAALHSVARGEMLCSPRIAASLAQHIAALAAAESLQATARLTPREMEILELIEEGLSNKEIACRLYIEVATVKNHVHNILEKLNVRGRVDAVAQVKSLRRRSSLNGTRAMALR
jgi:two-component system nitrate/nitrite response regulator NarL